MSLKSAAKLYKGIQDGELKDQVILDYFHFVATIQDGCIQKRLLAELIREYVVLEKRVDGLLKNTLPETVANEIKDRGRFAPDPTIARSCFQILPGSPACQKEFRARR